VIYLLAVPFALASAALAAYGLQTGLFAWIVSRRRPAPHAAALPGAWPRLTVQLPVYDEPAVVARLIDAACALDYPRGLIEIQVLDDSPEGFSSARAAERVAWWRDRGAAIEHIRRPTREGFKAGALAHGLSTARGDLICIFDADFVPEPDFLRRTVPVLVADDGVGLVQARWAHLNEHESWLTRSQAAVLDVHFVVEQGGRQRAGLPLAFNGTAGVWRRACIDAAGGWRADTLTEDLDLSYRAWLAGWQLTYVASASAPGELPPTPAALRRQQARWAKGTAETALLLWRRLVRSRMPLRSRIAAAFHLGAWIVHPGIMLVALVLAPLRLLSAASPQADLLWGAAGALGGLALVGVVLAHVVAARAVDVSPWTRILFVPAVMAMSAGLAVRCSGDVLQAFRGCRTPFHRTPKADAARTAQPESWRAELAFGISTAGAAIVLASNGFLMTAAFEALFASGALWLAMAGIDARLPRRPYQRGRPAVA
jgi:cellulose synthase/poly-beta-1,6-N-acetylglucosamine synthase-like glycosyltransferase